VREGAWRNNFVSKHARKSTRAQQQRTGNAPSQHTATAVRAAIALNHQIWEPSHGSKVRNESWRHKRGSDADLRIGNSLGEIAADCAAAAAHRAASASTRDMAGIACERRAAAAKRHPEERGVSGRPTISGLSLLTRETAHGDERHSAGASLSEPLENLLALAWARAMPAAEICGFCGSVVDIFWGLTAGSGVIFEICLGVSLR